MNNDNFDDIIKQKADNHQASFPPDVWDNIAKKKKKKLLPVFWWPLSSLMVVGVLFTYFHFNKIQHDGITMNQNNQAAHSLSQVGQPNTDLKNRANSISLSNNYFKSKQHNNNTNNAASKIHNDLVVDQRNESGNSLSQPDQPNDNLKENNNSNKVADNTLAIIKKQKENKIPNKQIYSDAADSKTLAQNNNLDKSSGKRASHINITSSINNKNKSLAYLKNKKHLYTQKGKYSATITDGTETSTVADNDIVTTDADERTNIESMPTQKNDSSINDSAIADIQKKSSVDSSIKNKKVIVDSTQAKNKTVIATNTKKHTLVIDFSVTPFSAIQHYKQMEYVTRVAGNNNAHSEYTTNSVQTTLQQPSVAFSVNIKKNISKRLLLGIGIQYSQIKENVTLSGQETDTDYASIQKLETGSSGPYLKEETLATTSNGVRVINAVNSYRLFSVPLFVTYTFYNHQSFSAAFTGGFYFTLAQYHNAIDGKLQSVYASGTQASNEKNNLATDIFGGVHLAWDVSKKYQLFAEPDFRYNLNKYELKNTFINKNIDQAGIAVGVSYKIR